MPNLLSDKPITSEEEDVLGLTSFVDAIAKSLSEMAPDEGIVISVEGEWGAGKTSAIQLTQRRPIIRELARELAVSTLEVERRELTAVEQAVGDITARIRAAAQGGTLLAAPEPMRRLSDSQINCRVLLPIW